MTTYTATTVTTVAKSICSNIINSSSSRHQNFSSASDRPKLEVFNSIQRASESESDDSFIVFQESSSTSNDYAYDFRGIRQVSECSSDDFFIFENGTTDTQFSYDTEHSSDDGDDDETDTECYLSHTKRQKGAQSMACQSINSEFKKKKRVKFNLCPIVHEIRAWKFAYAQARKGHWHQIGWDRERFQKRINDLSDIVTPILIADHRQKIYAERFREKFYE